MGLISHSSERFTPWLDASCDSILVKNLVEEICVEMTAILTVGDGLYKEDSSKIIPLFLPSMEHLGDTLRLESRYYMSSPWPGLVYCRRIVWRLCEPRGLRREQSATKGTKTQYLLIAWWSARLLPEIPGHKMLQNWHCIVGSVAEWSKALVLGTSLCGGVGSNPTAANSMLRVHQTSYFRNKRI